ncbi:glycerophosphodiester phosphodiesterase|uniref:Glycerophosphoryl diester phosphodiesterase n=1 Tax=Dendrosporobacter quercicolus TaxID=146817 RepID=A0A1G9YWD0_9FIRM|nr:glycerophosphodiester phosphodiesterase [Dendrosporobacter quercicolus]NSL49289.1 glycerophosphodiester phosphodiesterase [Dendrosporobacter quercicolus DSM 1736]SDN13207.1 glycerophosphoryl diester phosphodiesterase [Dendrosporobacter quercicolus]
MLIYAHRGARGYAPENTMAAFAEALRLKADGIELDVHLSRDGHVVICHEHTIDRTSNGHGWIRDLTLKQLKSYDFGSWFDRRYQGQSLVTLSEFMAWFTPTPLMLNIEIKNGPVIYPRIEEKIIAILQQFNASGRTIVSSFFHPSLSRIKELDGTLKTGILFECRPLNPLQFIRPTKADYLHPCWKSLDAGWCPAALAAGIGIHAYTVNTKEEYRFTAKMGARAVFTDYPDRFNTHAGPQ